LWSMDASLQEPRGKIGYVVKRANQKSKVDRSNAIAKRCRSANCQGLLSPLFTNCLEDVFSKT
jgi:hypothetical protein